MWNCYVKLVYFYIKRKQKQLLSFCHYFSCFRLADCRGKSCSYLKRLFYIFWGFTLAAALSLTSRMTKSKPDKNLAGHVTVNTARCWQSGREKWEKYVGVVTKGDGASTDKTCDANTLRLILYNTFHICPVL